MSKAKKIETISIMELPEGVVPFKYVVEELNVDYTSLRQVGINMGITFYKFADQVLCVNKKEIINAWNNRPKIGRPSTKK